jgi:uncharacterized tellurite resistance protein B-like protein
MGLGSAVYALAKADGQLQPAETETVKQLLTRHPHGEVAVSAYSLKEAYNVPVEEAYAFALRRFNANRHELTEPLKKEFVAILEEVAQAHDDVSRKEEAFIRRFRRDLRRL